FDQRALRLGYTNRLALAAVDALPAPVAAVPAGGLQSFAAEVAGVVGPHERRDDQVTRVQAGHVPAGLLDDAEELVADPVPVLCGVAGPVRPQVAATDARAHHTDDRVGRLVQGRVG